jgi:type VI secretion system secreted protein VgrG
LTRSRVCFAVAAAACLCAAVPAAAQTAPPLGTAQSFAVLGGSTVTNTGPSVITGDLGVSPGSAVTGFPPGSVVSGTVHAADAVAAAAESSVTTAYNNLAGQACTQDLTGQDLGGKTLTAGVYCFSTSAQLTGILTLNAQGNANAVFIFKIGSTLTTASGASVLITNGGSVCNVFWQVGSSATLGTTTAFGGNILALTSITLNTGASITGRALARNGAVTLDSNNVNASLCQAACPVIALSPTTLATGSVDVPYSQTLTASGGVAPYVFTVSAGTLPAGMTLTPAGVLAGTPTAPGTATVTIRATDANGCLAERTYSLLVVTPLPTLPQMFVLMLALGLAAMGYVRLQRRGRAR